jgi:hypothetical protein
MHVRIVMARRFVITVNGEQFVGSVMVLVYVNTENKNIHVEIVMVRGCVNIKIRGEDVSNVL